MLPALKVTYIKSGRLPVTIRSIVLHCSKNRTLKTIRMLSIQTYSTCSENGEEIRKSFQYVHDAGICPQHHENLENLGLQIGKNRASGGMLKCGV